LAANGHSPSNIQTGEALQTLKRAKPFKLMPMKLELTTRESRAIAVLAILYAVGIAGVAFSIHEDFLKLTPVNLLVSLGIVLWLHPQWSRRSVFFLALCYIVGFGAELFGVQTGLLFGSYEYGDVLGWKVWDTPLMIGVNWMILAYCSGVTVNHLAPRRPWPARAIAAALIMVALDVLIEPAAMRYGFWSWENDAVPLQNYFGWFIVALPLLAFFAVWQEKIQNKAAVALLIMQFVFFLSLNVL
jgi:bisanhydrobacterioruberin hydratase